MIPLTIERLPFAVRIAPGAFLTMQICPASPARLLRCTVAKGCGAVAIIECPTKFPKGAPATFATLQRMRLDWHASLRSPLLLTVCNRSSRPRRLFGYFSCVVVDA